jgi:hypothetical protein
MKLILHIGTEKTGTTTTQHWAARNRDALLRQGVRYSQVLGAVSHSKLYLWCLAPGRQDEGFKHINVSSEADLLGFRSRLQEEFAGEVSEAGKSGCHTFLISNELCHSRLVTLEEVQRAREFLEPHFDQVEILCGLRPQIDLAVSHTSNVAKGRDRITKAYFERIGPELTYYNYKTFVERWSTVFGAGKLSLVPIRRTPDFTDIVAARAGLDTTDLQPPVRSNEALDVRVMAMTNAMKAQRLEGRWIEPFAYIPREVLRLLPCEERLQPGLELAKSFQARFEESNRDLTNGRTDVEMADLEPDWSRYEGAGNLDLLEQPCAFSRELAGLVQLFNQNIALAQAQHAIAEAERHLRHPLIAQRRLNLALRLLALLKQAGSSSHRIRRLEARTASVEMELEDSRDRPPKRRHRAGKPRHGKRRADANGQGGASEVSATEQDIT